MLFFSFYFPNLEVPRDLLWQFPPMSFFIPLHLLTWQTIMLPTFFFLL